MKIAVQKNGKLTDQSLSFLTGLGICRVEGASDLLSPCDNKTDLIIYMRDDDIPGLVAGGYVDAGIVGKDILLESGANVPYTQEIGFGQCRLIIAVPKSSDIEDVKDLEGAAIATSYPKILENFLGTYGVVASTIALSGSVEIAPKIGIAEAVCDIVVTGGTLRQNGLRELISILDSEAVLITNTKTAYTQLAGHLDPAIICKN